MLRNGRLADIQAQQVEVGRIRLGTSQTKTSRAGREYQEPVKLERFRLTSKSEQLIREAAGLYGGEVEPWMPQSGGVQQWEVVIDKTSIPVIVPPEPCSQYYEQWTGGKCARRCDGRRELIGETLCVCGPDPDQKKQNGCKPTTRLSLMLAEMNGVGIWRLESHGFYAAAEIPAVADLLSAAGGNIPARLEMQERSAQLPDTKNPGKTITSRFMVPVLHVEATPAAIVGTFSGRLAIEAPAADPTSQAPAQSEEVNAEQWKLHGAYEDRINQATERAAMMVLRAEFRADSALEQQFLDNLEILWNDRAKALIAAASAASPSTPTASSGSAPPSTTGQPLDRNALWLEVNTIAGYKQLKLSDLRRLFGEWGQGGDELTRATAEALLAFRDWLKAKP